MTTMSSLGQRNITEQSKLLTRASSSQKINSAANDCFGNLPLYVIEDTTLATNALSPSTTPRETKTPLKPNRQFATRTRLAK